MNKKICVQCGSFIFDSFHENGLCDVCYWRTKYEKAEAVISEIAEVTSMYDDRGNYIFHLCHYGMGAREKPNKKDFGL